MVFKYSNAWLIVTYPCHKTFINFHVIYSKYNSVNICTLRFFFVIFLSTRQHFCIVTLLQVSIDHTPATLITDEFHVNNERWRKQRAPDILLENMQFNIHKSTSISKNLFFRFPPECGLQNCLPCKYLERPHHEINFERQMLILRQDIILSLCARSRTIRNYSRKKEL